MCAYVLLSSQKCHVSLVSQWIDEAKSKLNNPGLVYAYHGQSRKRDAMILAQNAIIVTTYATLAKDATYHAGKATKNGESDYCPPCEQIRWWRIICDESHTLKQDTVQTKAVMNLVGDHKWAVSGKRLARLGIFRRRRLRLTHVFFRYTMEHLFD
jgi:SNF2 family DNA or RNA helicase